MTAKPRDHGGGLDAAVARFGGSRETWIDLSTGINPQPYPLPEIPHNAWTALPDADAQAELLKAARDTWQVPVSADILAASGVSALIAQLPQIAHSANVCVQMPTYNEYAAAFEAHNGLVGTQPSDTNIYVHPNNPDGRLFSANEILDRHQNLSVIDESFCDVLPQATLVHLAQKPGFIVLKGLGKFWGLAGLRLGFAIAQPETIARLRALIGPWAVSGPAQTIGTAALRDTKWAEATRARLAADAQQLDALMMAHGGAQACGTDLFRLYSVSDAATVQEKLAKRHIWTRIFPYSGALIRLGLPSGLKNWDRLKAALES